MNHFANHGSPVDAASDSAMARPNTARNRKIQRHGANSTINWPTEGAMTGTARKTMKASDMTCAIFRPE